jgi:hypothetical protein
MRRKSWNARGVEHMSDEHKRYKVIKPYTSYCYGFPLELQVGSVGEWFEQVKGYTFSPAVVSVTGAAYTVWATKYAVENWHDYFEPIQD